MRARILVVCLLSVALLLSVVPSANALYKSTDYYDRIAWTWKYYAPWTRTYNCLSYALGYRDRWIWPWTGRPTVEQCNTYMSKRGYKWVTKSGSPTIIAYGWRNSTRNEVDHFARVVNGTTTRAKWGSLEVMTSYSWSPYFSSSYGGTVAGYRPR